MKKIGSLALMIALTACNDKAANRSVQTPDSTTNRVYSTSVTIDTAVNPTGDTADSKSRDSLR